MPLEDTALDASLWVDGMTCHICGADILQHHPFNYDHVVPMALGGAKGKANKTFTHVLCNMVKGSAYPFFMRTPAERERVRRLVKPSTYARLQLLWIGR